MSERQSDTARFKQDLDEHITKSDEPDVTESKHWSELAAEALWPEYGGYPVRGYSAASDAHMKSRLADAIRTALEKAGYEVRKSEAQREVEEHLEELREAWKRGCIRDTDGLGGTRSNRNMDLLLKLQRETAAPPARKET